MEKKYRTAWTLGLLGTVREDGWITISSSLDFSPLFYDKGTELFRPGKRIGEVLNGYAWRWGMRRGALRHTVCPYCLYLDLSSLCYSREDRTGGQYNMVAVNGARGVKPKPITGCGH